MKKIIFATLFMLTTVALFAQKLEKANYGQHTYIQPPSNPALINYKSFIVKVSVPDGNSYHVDETRAASQLEGYKKTTDESKADFILKYTVYTTSFSEPKYEMQTHTKENDGVKTVSYTHTFKGGYEYKTRLNIQDMEGNELYEVLEEGYTKVQKSSSDSKKAARNIYDNYLNKVKPNITNNTVKKLNDRTAEVLSFMEKKAVMKFIKVKPKKFTYDAFNAATNDIQKAVNNKDKDAVKEICEKAIAAWEEDLKESDLSSKKARVNKSVTAGAYYNIALAYFLMDDFSNAASYFDRAASLNKNVTNQHFTLTKIAANLEERQDALPQ